MTENAAISKPPTTTKPTSSSGSSSDPFFSLIKSALTLCLLLSISLIILAALFHRPTLPSPAHWLSLRPTSRFRSTPTTTTPSPSLCKPDPDPSPTQLHHLLFNLGGSAKTLEDRRPYTDLWWDPNTTRGFIWLDEPPNSTYTWPHHSPPYRISTPIPGPSGPPQPMRPSDRMARILKEAFEVGVPRVRWFVMGDDDTVFFPHNLVTVLSRYDHRQMFYVGGPSESVEQDVMHGYDTAFGGGGFAVSYPLACAVVAILDGCIQRYNNYYGSDEKFAACVAEVGVPFTREPGFHQLDVRDNAYGLLAAHPMAPLVSLHHLDAVNPLFPGQTQLDSLKKLIHAYHVDPGHIVQQSFCYDHGRKWSVSISWGYTAQLYPSLIPSRVLSIPLHTFRTWRSWQDGPFVFNTRLFMSDPCAQPIIYYMDRVEDIGDGKTITTYKRVARSESGQKCNQASYLYAMSVEKIIVSASKASPDMWLKAPRRDCCEITDSWSANTNMRIKLRSCKAGETITI